MRIIKNAAECVKCGDVIESKYRHDFVSCSRGAIFVDGGHDNLRRRRTPWDLIDRSEQEEEEDAWA